MKGRFLPGPVGEQGATVPVSCRTGSAARLNGLVLQHHQQESV